MSAKELIKEATLPHALNFGLGAISPVLIHSRRGTPPGELMSRAIGGGVGGMGGAYLGVKGGGALANKLLQTSAAKSSGKVGKLLRGIAWASPGVADLIMFGLGSGVGSKAGKRLHQASKEVMKKRWGKGRPEGIVKSVSVPAASTYEMLKREL